MKPLLVCTLLLAGATAAAGGQTMFRSGVDAVELDVSVMRGGAPVHGLTADNFLVTDNGVPQEVTSVTQGGLPLAVTFLLDVSQSVSGARLDNLIQAGQATAQALRAGDHAALVTFSHHVRMDVPLTPDLPRLRGALQALTGSGATALRDAVQLAIAVRPELPSRSLLLLFSDGVDTASWVTEEDVIGTVRRAGTVIHGVRVGRDRFLERLTEASGGRTWEAASDRELQELFTRALEEMRARYRVTYSLGAEPAAGWHAIDVRLKGARGDVTARPGYVVPPARPTDAGGRPTAARTIP